MKRELEPKRRRLLPLAVAALVLFALGSAIARLWPKPIAYEVSGAELEGPYVSAASNPVSVEFSEGSLIRAEPDARLRIDQRRFNGARVLVERGRAAVDVQRRLGSEWSFVGGPFEVSVTGARFELAWDEASEVLEIGVRDGSVEVRGPLGGTVAVRPGQRFRAELAVRRMTVDDTGAELAAEEADSSPEPVPSVAE